MLQMQVLLVILEHLFMYLLETNVEVLAILCENLKGKFGLKSYGTKYLHAGYSRLFAGLFDHQYP